MVSSFSNGGVTAGGGSLACPLPCRLRGSYGHQALPQPHGFHPSCPLYQQISIKLSLNDRNLILASVPPHPIAPIFAFLLKFSGSPLLA